jgi:hypothetical protein
MLDKVCSVFFLAIFISTIVVAEELTIPKLTGGESKTWMFKTFDVSLGSEVSCTTGKSYVFRLDNSVTIKECMNGAIQAIKHRFELSSDGIDTYITFLDVGYRAIYNTQMNSIGLEQEELVLRAEGSKTKPTIDIILSHIE